VLSHQSALVNIKWLHCTANSHSQWVGEQLLSGDYQSALHWPFSAINKMDNNKIRQGNRRLHYTQAVHSHHPLPSDRRCGLSWTCRRRTEPQT